MANQLIRERACDRDRGIDVRAALADSKKFWASPAGKAEERRLEVRRAKARLRVLAVPSRFPELAKRSGTRPATGTLAEVKDWAARFGIPTR